MAPGLRSYQLQAFDFSGEPLENRTIAIENTTVVAPASASNLVISELMYHPTPPTAVEFSAGFSDQDQFEFVELLNIGSEAIDLTGVSFSGGIAFDFGGILLEAGERKVLARDRAAFLARYPGLEEVLFPGEYFGASDTNQFSNAGERVTLSDAQGFAIRDFVYGDDQPWPVEADGNGFSLTLAVPFANPDHALLSSWRRSLAEGGSPGVSDELTFVGDPVADEDGDGLGALLEFATGSDDLSFDSGPTLERDFAGHLLFRYTRQLGTEGVLLEPEVSRDLENWEDLTGSFLLTPSSGDTNGLRTLLWRSFVPLDGQPVFLRLRARTP